MYCPCANTEQNRKAIIAANFIAYFFGHAACILSAIAFNTLDWSTPAEISAFAALRIASMIASNSCDVRKSRYEIVTCGLGFWAVACWIEVSTRKQLSCLGQSTVYVVWALNASAKMEKSSVAKNLIVVL